MIDLIKNDVKQRINKSFPNVRVLPVNLHEDVNDITIFVFDVPEEQVEEVRNFILDLDIELGNKHNIVLTPQVKSEEITRKYYSAIPH